jgi:spermidine synthase
MSSLGKHILAEFSGCTPEVMNDVGLIENAMVEAAKTAGATLINTTFHHFSPYGVSGVIVIQESHLAIHTWPEYGYASVDIFTCGDQVDPWVSCKFLKKAFEATDLSAIELKRGSLELLDRADISDLNKRSSAKQSGPEHKLLRDVWFTDKDDDQALSVRHTGEILFREQTDFQTVQILDSYRYGKFLTLDDMIMTTEKDHFQYHEMIAHTPIFAHGNVKNVLIIGGGDGGGLNEVLRHDGVEKITLVEIDEAVVRASTLHLDIAKSAFTHEKVDVRFEDGIKFVAESLPEAYDLIIVDGSEPVGPAEGLFTLAFYQDCFKALKANGVLVAQGESPRFNEQAFCKVNHLLRSSFGAEHVFVNLFFIPTYPTGMWSFQWGTKGVDPRNIAGKEQRIDSFVESHDLQYYNADVHTASFALPNFVKSLLRDGKF